MPIGSLQADPNPQRKHSERQIANLMGAIRQFDIVRPLLITDDGFVIDGHGVLEAARRLEIEEIPVVRVGGFSRTELRALSMALNRLGDHAKWDHDVLRADFIALRADPEIEFSFDVTGFDQVFIDTLTLEAVEEAEQDDVPDVDAGPVTSRLGERWLCGRHVIACGDSRDPAIYPGLMTGLLAQMVFGDVPYNVKIRGNVSGLGRVAHEEFAMASGEMSQAEFTAFQTVIFKNCADVSVDGALHYYFIDGRHVGDQITAGKAVFGDMKQLVVWVKPAGGMGGFYRSRHELVTIWKVGDAAHVNNFGLGGTGRYRTNVWEYPGYASFGADRDEALSWHPTVKPVAMIMDAILDVTRQDDVVLDPFGGSGTTLIAAERTNRVARLIEIDPQYVDVTLKRFIALTGEEPVLAQTGEAFSQVQARRGGEGPGALSPSGAGDADDWDIA
ncbi:MAG: DNA methyltransferase [Caulobacter sp.]